METTQTKKDPHILIGQPLLPVVDLILSEHAPRQAHQSVTQGEQ